MADRYDQDMLLAYLEGELPPDQQAALQQQLAHDARLRRLLDQLAHDRRGLRQLPHEQPPPQLVDDVMHQFERQMLLGSPSAEPLPEDAPPARQRPRGVRIAAYTGLAAAVGLCAGVILWTLLDQDALREADQLDRLARQEQAQPESDGDHAPPQPQVDPSPAPTPTFEQLLAESASDAEPPAGSPEAADVDPSPRPLVGAAPADADTEQAPALAQGPSAPSPEQLAAAVVDPRIPQAVVLGGPGHTQAAGFASEPPPPRELTVHVHTADANRTERQVLAWAADRNIRVTSAMPALAPGRADPSPEAGDIEADTLGQAETERSARQEQSRGGIGGRTGQAELFAEEPDDDPRPSIVELQLHLPTARLDDLLSDLNHQPGQRADLAVDTASLPLAASPTPDAQEQRLTRHDRAQQRTAPAESTRRQRRPTRDNGDDMAGMEDMMRMMEHMEAEQMDQDAYTARHRRAEPASPDDTPAPVPPAIAGFDWSRVLDPEQAPFLAPPAPIEVATVTVRIQQHP